MKKIIALALALIMVLSMATVALATGVTTPGTGETTPGTGETTPGTGGNTPGEDDEEVEEDDGYTGDMVFVDGVNADANMDLAEYAEGIVAPGEKITLIDADLTKADIAGWKISYDFTSAYIKNEDGERVKVGFCGISMIESIAWEKSVGDNGGVSYKLVLTLKENYTSTTKKLLAGLVTLTNKKLDETLTLYVMGDVNNESVYIDGSKKAADATPLTVDGVSGISPWAYTDDEICDMMKNVVMIAEDGAGYVTFTDEDALTGLVKVENNEKAQVYFDDLTEDETDAIDAYLGEDYEAIVEYYKFTGTGFKNDVDFTYEAYAEDPHFFYAWDGEKFVDLEGKYNDDEDVEAYEFTAAAKGIIIVTDVEIVAGDADSKNPDTGANDVVGVATALAVVSLVAAGAVSLKK